MTIDNEEKITGDISIKVELEQLRSRITVDELLAMQEGDMKAIVGIMSHFVHNKKGKALSREDGRKAIGKLTIDEMILAAEDFTKAMKDTAVPPPNAS